MDFNIWKCNRFSNSLKLDLGQLHGFSECNVPKWEYESKWRRIRLNLNFLLLHVTSIEYCEDWLEIEFITLKQERNIEVLIKIF